MWIMTYIKLGIILIAIVCFSYIPISFIARKKGIKKIRNFSYLGLLFSFLLIIFATLIIFNKITFTPEKYHLSIIPFIRFKEDEINIVKTLATEIIPNVFIFIPLGIFIPIVFKGRRNITSLVILILLTTLFVETFQYFTGRMADIDDIITNLLGGVIGYLIFKKMNKQYKVESWWCNFIN